MNKGLIVMLVLGVFLFASLVYATNDSNSTINSTEGNETEDIESNSTENSNETELNETRTTSSNGHANVTKTIDKENGTLVMTKTVETGKGEISMTKTITRSCDSDDSCSVDMQKTITIERTMRNETIIRSKSISVSVNGSIETDENNKTFFKWDNMTREIKIMPDTAAARAIERLGLKVCNESNNCTIVLKDVGQREGNQTKLKYFVQALKEKRFLWWKWHKQVQAQVDAETGVVN